MRRLAIFAVSLLVGACDGQFRFEEGDAGALPDAAAEAQPVSPCRVDADCRLASLHCDAVSGACVECTRDTQCLGDEKRCDSALHRCVACGNDADCGPGGACEPTTHQCLVRCVDKTEPACPTKTPTCDEKRGVCIACQKNADCAGADDGNLCDLSIGRCVFCLTDDECPAIWPRCDRPDGRCRQCLTSADCEHNEPCDPIKFTCL